METVRSGWQQLQTDSNRKCPKLFYEFTADTLGYMLQFTDLIGLWTSQSTVEDIKQYAKATRATIDPSESDDQIRILVQKLCQSLSEGKNALRQDENSNDEGLLLVTTIELPDPLKPLQWEFYLESKGAAEMAESILRPCLHDAAEAQKKITSLIDVISTKDRAILKLLEKIESSAMDLSLIFPGITGVRSRKGHTTVREAQRHIPGLAEFRQDDWQKFFKSDSPYAGFTESGLSKLVIGCEQCPKHTPQQHHTWLQKLPKASATTSQIAQAELNRSSSPVRDESSTESEEEFETQKKRQRETSVLVSGYEKTSKRAKLSSLKRSSEGHRSKTSSQSGSSSRSSSPPPLPTTHCSYGHSTSSTDSETSSDLDSQPKRKDRLGPSSQKSRDRPHPARRANASSTLAVDAAPHSEPSSSPPAPDQAVIKNSHYLRPNKSATALDSAIRNDPITPRKLSHLRVEGKETQRSPSTTPEHGGAGINTTSTQTPPSRRRGRLGKGTSQAHTQSPHTQRTTTHADETEIDNNEHEGSGNASDTSTASSATPSPVQKLQSPTAAHAITSTTIRPPRTSPPTDRDEESDQENEELSKEERANRRREELKRKIGAHGTTDPRRSGPNIAAAGQGGGLRKKRKF